MKLVLPLAAVALISATGFAAALDAQSKAPAWTSASKADKDSWMKSFKFEKATADRTKIAACLDNYATLPMFTTNALTGLTSLCETVVEKTVD